MACCKPQEVAEKVAPHNGPGMKIRFDAGLYYIILSADDEVGPCMEIHDARCPKVGEMRGVE